MCADNAQKVPFGSSIHRKSESQILGHIQLMGGRAPGKIKAIDKTNTILTIQFLTDPTVYQLPDVTIPVHGPEYTRFPYQVGDMGAVGSFDLDVGNVTGLGQAGNASFTRPANLASLVFHPLGNKNFTPTDDPKAHLSYGNNGTIARDVGKKSQVKTHPTEGATIQGGGDGAGNFPHSSTADSTGVTHKSTMMVKTDAPTHDVTGNQSVGGFMAAVGAVSGSTGSFPSGISGGGLQMLSGIISAIGGSGGGITAASLATGAAQQNIVGSGLPQYPDATTARTALGPGAFYINTNLGSSAGGSVPVSGGTGGGSVTLPASPSFYSQGILVVCVTGP